MFGFPISQSAPHIYLSALTFSPQSSAVFKRFREDFPQVLKVAAGADNYWPAAQHNIHAGCKVGCIAISPDGLWIVSGLDDSTIRVWDVTSMIGDIGGSQVALRSDNNSHNVPTKLFGIHPSDLGIVRALTYV